MSCCVAKRQIDLLGFRLVDQASMANVIVGEVSPGGYTVRSLKPRFWGGWTAIVDIPGRGTHAVDLGSPRACPGSAVPVLFIPS